MRRGRVYLKEGFINLYSTVWRGCGRGGRFVSVWECVIVLSNFWQGANTGYKYGDLLARSRPIISITDREEAASRRVWCDLYNTGYRTLRPSWQSSQSRLDLPTMQTSHIITRCVEIMGDGILWLNIKRTVVNVNHDLGGFNATEKDHKTIL